MNKPPPWIWHARCTHWVFKKLPVKSAPIRIAPCMDPYFEGSISRDEMAQAARNFKKAGVNMVLTEGLRRLMLYESQGITSQVNAVIKAAVKNCHAQGIKIIHHTTASFVGQELDMIPEAWREWLSIDAQTGNYAFLNLWGGWYLWCINNPEFRAEYFRLCKKIAAETGVDGFMVDEVYFRTGWYDCACRHCREKYRKMTGHILPDASAGYFWGNFENPAFREWLRFRCVSVGNFYEDLYQVLAKVRPDCVLMGCKSAEVYPYGTQQFGDSSEERARGINTLFIELSASVTAHLYSWRFLSANLMIYAAMSHLHGTPTIATMYHRKEERFFNWALRLAHGARVWATASVAGDGDLGSKSNLFNYPEDLKLYAGLFAWAEKHRLELDGPSEPLAGVGIFLGESTRDMLDHGTGNDYEKEFVGWCEFLADEGIQYDVILEAEQNLSRLQDFSLIILPNTVCLSNFAIRAIHEYVKAGGSLILTHKSGERNNDGSARMESQWLRALLGMNQISKKNVVGVEYGVCGHGKWVYFAHKPGTFLYSTLNRINTIRKRDAACFFYANDICLQKSLMLGAVQWALEKPTPLKIKKMPEGVLIKAFRKIDDGNVIVHILNCRGENAVNYGMMIPRKYDVAFPKIKQDIVIEYNLSAVRRAYLFSPDWKGARSVDAIQKENRGFELTVPANSLKRYEVLYIEVP